MLRVALVGNPNSGKTTLFNALTGLRQKIANYPGVTVEKKTGRCVMEDGSAIELIDLPGTYSLVPTSPDERVAAEILRGLRADTPAPDAVIAVVDAANLARNLLLVSQLIDAGAPLVIALTMGDVAARRGVRVDAAALASALGVPVIAVHAPSGAGLPALSQAVRQAQTATRPPRSGIPAALAGEVAALVTALTSLPALTTLPALTALPAATASGAGQAAQAPEHIALRLLTGDHLGLERLADDPGIAAGLATAQQRLRTAGSDAIAVDISARYAHIDAVIAAAVTTTPQAAPLTERVDRLLLHPFLGVLAFVLVMGGLFTAIFLLAAPLMEICQDGVKELGTWCTSGLSEGPLKSLLNDGVFAGVGAVVVFAPQIALLFALLALLEDSGYLARAAFLMDRLFSRLGLNGRSFVPLLSSFACAIPGIYAARGISSTRERLLTIFVAPFMSCSARLPVYLLLVGTFFAHWSAWGQGLLFLGCYLLGILAAAATALAITLWRGRGAATPFILELPVYQRPQWRHVALQTWQGVRLFLTRAGTTIFALSVLLWALSTYPRPSQAEIDAARAAFAVQWEAAHPAAPATTASPGSVPVVAALAPAGSASPADSASAAETARAAAEERALAAAALAGSAAGRLGHAIEPIIAPLGFDWKIGVGLVGAFAAREVFVGTLGIVYGVGDPDQREGDEAKDVASAELRDLMRADRHGDGRPVWGTLTAITLLVWFVLAMQCISTTAVVRREGGGWKIAIAQLAFMNTLAWIVCCAVYQIGSRL